MLACENNKIECVQFLFRKYDNLDFNHKNNKGEDAINIIQKMIRSKYSEAGDDSHEIKQRFPVNDNNDYLSKSDYLKQLLLLINEVSQKAIDKLNPVLKTELNTGIYSKFNFNIFKK